MEYVYPNKPNVQYGKPLSLILLFLYILWDFGWACWKEPLPFPFFPYFLCIYFTRPLLRQLQSSADDMAQSANSSPTTEPAGQPNNIKGSVQLIRWCDEVFYMHWIMCALPVKIYYTFKGNATTCLCTFETSINNIKNEKWVDVPLKRCLLAVCSSW
jgi:hypothetical protein